jgi:dihydrofolate reductase
MGKVITAVPKVVFSRTLEKSEWPNATVATGEIAAHVNQLKCKPGKTYSCMADLASLIEYNLIDEYHLLVNPVALGCGLTIFSTLKDTLRPSLVTTKSFSCGTVLLRYEQFRAQ